MSSEACNIINIHYTSFDNEQNQRIMYCHHPNLYSTVCLIVCLGCIYVFVLVGGREASLRVSNVTVFKIQGEIIIIII